MQTQTVLQTQQQPQLNALDDRIQSDLDRQAQDLFNQIQIDSPIQQNYATNLKQSQQVALRQEQNKTPLKKKRKNVLLLNSDQSEQDQQQANKQKQNNDHEGKHELTKKQRKQRKKQKKLRKLQKIKQKKQKKQGKLKKMKKVGQKQKNSQNEQENKEWSGQSSHQQSDDSNQSSDSLLNKLNPSNKKKLSQRNIESTQKKQGFSLKQLGNDAEVGFIDDENASDSSFKNNKNKKNKKRVDKKQYPKNQQLIKGLVQIGLCTEQDNIEGNKQIQIDNGLDQVYNIKNNKKKGPKIANKLFCDIQIAEQKQDDVDKPRQLQLEIKPRINCGPSLIANSFLAKTQKLKKARGMQSQMQNQDYQKLISMKAKQSVIRLINQKQLQQADEIQLDVKVPQVVRGSGQINNSMFLKRISSSSNNKSNDNKDPSPKFQKIVKQNELPKKMTRFDFFKSISQQLKAKKSKQITDQIIKNRFKVTQLEQIQQMRRKNQQKRRRQALIGSDQEDDSYDQYMNKNQFKSEGHQSIKQNNLGFMNFKVQVPKQKMDENIEVNNGQNINKQNSENAQKSNSFLPELHKGELRKTKSFNIQIKKSIPDKEVMRLLALEQAQAQMHNRSQEEEENYENQQLNEILGNQMQDENEEQNQNQKQKQKQIQKQGQENEELHGGQEDHMEQNQLSQQQLQSAERVNLQVELEVENSKQPDQQQQQQEQEQAEQAEEPINIADGKQKINEEYRHYLNELQEEGINIKKKNRQNEIQSKLKIRAQSNNAEKQNDKMLENSNSMRSQEQNQLRRQFRKLRKFAVIIKQKKHLEEKKKKALQFFDEEAEEGSDNEQHDQQVKKINYDEEAKQYEGLDLDADLQQLIDNAVNIDEQDEERAFQKYMEDVKIKDREELKRIMRGDFKRKGEQEGMMDEMDQDQKQRMQRMERFNQYLKMKENQQGKQLYMQQQKSNEQQDQNEDEDSYNGKSQKQKKKKKQINSTQQEQQQYEQYDQMNEQNLKRYLDDAIVDNFRSTIKVKKTPTQVQLPQSSQRSKQTEMRNSLKFKASEMQPTKLKKTSSHLNEMIMKNKQKVKPIPLLKGIPLLGRR